VVGEPATLRTTSTTELGLSVQKSPADQNATQS
jgi:hypothetical protein